MTMILAILSHTPIWVWAVFALVIFMGLQRTRDRAMPIWRLLLLPVVMLGLAASSLAGTGASALPAIVVGVMIGGVCGWLLERDGATRRLANGQIWLRGEWLSLVQVVAIFVFRYATSVAVALNPGLADNAAYHLGMALVSSLLSAMILGRTLARLRVYRQSVPAAA